MKETRMGVFQKAVPAGVCIGIGCVVYMMAPNQLAGAVLFTVGLFTICWFGLYLYTGKVGHVIETRNTPDCLMILLGNAVGIAIVCELARCALPEIQAEAQNLVAVKLSQSLSSCIARSTLCGGLMYVAVDNYARQHDALFRALGIALCVPVFILCGFEHSIADMGYFLLAMPVQPLTSVAIYHHGGHIQWCGCDRHELVDRRRKMNSFLRLYDEKVQDYPMDLKITYTKATGWHIDVWWGARGDRGEDASIVAVQDRDLELCFAWAYVMLKEWFINLPAQGSDPWRPVGYEEVEED